MTGRYTPLRSSIWADPDFVALTANAQRVYLLAISQPNISYAGVVPFTEKRWAGMASDTTRGSICDGVNELEDARFVLLDDETEELMVRSFVKHNKIFEQKQLHNALARAFDGVLSPGLQAAFLAEQPPEVVDYLASRSAAAKALVGSLGAGSPSPCQPPSPAGTGLGQGLDLDPQPEPEEGDQASREVALGGHVLMAPGRDRSLSIELDGIVMVLADQYDTDRVAAAVADLERRGRRFMWPSDARKALVAVLGDPPTKSREPRVCFDESVEQQIARLSAQLELVGDERDREAIADQLAALGAESAERSVG